MKKTALITGSTSGIGLAIAKKLAELGYQICFNGLEKDGADIAKEVATTYGVPYSFSPANLLDRSALKTFAEEALKQFGSIDILVNNAGIQFVSPIEDFPEEKWDAIINLNLTAAFLLTKVLWAPMKHNISVASSISHLHMA